MKIVFFGNEQLAQGLEKPITPILDALVVNYEIIAIVLPRRLEALSGHNRKPLVIGRAEQSSIPLIYADQEVNLDATLRELNAEIGVLASYGQIVKQSTIDIFPHGIVNIHPSLLPKYRGSTPIETAILNGDSETGVSLMNLVKEMDAGGIYVQEKILLDGTESKQELYEKLAKLGAKLLTENLPQIISGELSPTPQDERNATYSSKIAKLDGDLDSATMTATECERRIRAFAEWPKSRLIFRGQKTIITKAKALVHNPGDNWPDIIICANDTALQIIELINPKSGKVMLVKDYLNGLRN